MTPQDVVVAVAVEIADAGNEPIRQVRNVDHRVVVAEPAISRDSVGNADRLTSDLPEHVVAIVPVEVADSKDRQGACGQTSQPGVGVIADEASVRLRKPVGESAERVAAP